jgi:hypothetical protein
LDLQGREGSLRFGYFVLKPGVFLYEIRCDFGQRHAIRLLFEDIYGFLICQEHALGNEMRLHEFVLLHGFGQGFEPEGALLGGPGLELDAAQTQRIVLGLEEEGGVILFAKEHSVQCQIVFVNEANLPTFQCFLDHQIWVV